MAQEIIIAGAGVAGLSAARELSPIARDRGIHITVVAPDALDKSLSTRRRSSTPIILKATAEKLGIDMTNIPEVSTTLCRGFHDGEYATRVSRGGKPFLAIEAESTRRKLIESLEGVPPVSLIEGAGSQLHIERERVRGIVLAGEKEVRNAELVIDATGRSARLAGMLEQDQIVEVRRKSESCSLACYIELDSTQIQDRFPRIEETFFREMLDEGIMVALLPTERIDGNATHLMIIEGNPEQIRASQYLVKRMSNRRLSPEEMHLAVMQRLTAGTEWATILSEAKSFDRFTSFTHRFDERRTPRVPGLVLIGDAQINTSPNYGRGFSYIASDIKLLRKLITAHGLAEGAQIYTTTMSGILEQRFERTTRDRISYYNFICFDEQ